MKLTQDEFLKIIAEIMAEENIELTSEENYCYHNDISEKVENIKNKIKRNNSVIDITLVKKDDLKSYLLKNKRFIMGKFTIELDKYIEEDKYRISLWEKRVITNTGQPCNIDCRINLKKDERFNQCDWIKYFCNKPIARISDNWSQAITIDEVTKIVRYLQVVGKLPLFI